MTNILGKPVDDMATSDIDVCDSCYDAVVDAAMTVGEDVDDPSRVSVLARTSGGDIFEHDCDAEEDDDIVCNCSCH